jgi:hypothetical protein
MTNAVQKQSERWRRRLAAIVALTLLVFVSCLGEPEIDERWTKVEFLDASPQSGQSVQAAQSVDVSVKSRITYRRILTGFLVAEVRYSDTVTPASVALDPARHTLESAQIVDLVLANSVTAGRATRPVTGWDHLMQDFSLSFTAQVPDSATSGGLYLLLYMGEGEEIELQDGRDSLIVTPFVSTDYEVLHTGFALGVSGGGS